MGIRGRREEQAGVVVDGEQRFQGTLPHDVGAGVIPGGWGRGERRTKPSIEREHSEHVEIRPAKLPPDAPLGLPQAGTGTGWSH